MEQELLLDIGDKKKTGKPALSYEQKLNQSSLLNALTNIQEHNKCG